ARPAAADLPEDRGVRPLRPRRPRLHVGEDGQGRRVARGGGPEAGGARSMSVTVVGSVAFDRLETPWGTRERVLGGAATHFSLAASFFTDVRVVGVVGDDFGEAEFDVFRERGIDTSDVERVPGGKSFF